MANEILLRRFAAIGARVQVIGPPFGGVRLDVRADTRGELFDVRFTGNGRPVELEVVDVDRADRHLLLLVRDGGEKSKFLCGFDERHWFVAAVPEDARGVTGVKAAKAALQPALVRDAVERVRPKHPQRRRNVAFMRQGEWFFVPVALDPPAAEVHRREPLTRGGGRVHMLELAYRRGGRVVWVNNENRGGLTDEQFRRLPERKRRSGGWSRMTRDPELYAKGAVTHPDHATVILNGWHRVVMNTEQKARAMEHVVFLD